MSNNPRRPQARLNGSTANIKVKKQPLKNHCNSESSKLSNVRYGAMKRLELPCQKNFRQTTLHGFGLNKIKNKKCNELNIQQVDKRTKDNVPSMNDETEKIVSSSIHTSCSESNHLFLTKSFNKENTNDTSKKTRNPTNVQACNNANKHLTCQNSVDFSANQNRLLDEKYFVHKTNILLPTDNKLNDDELYDNKLNGDEQNLNRKTIDDTDINVNSNDSANYEMTMKFATDSQGNKIFDRFTQKYIKPHDHMDSSLSEAELQFYVSFENDLMSKNNCQSTQYV